MSNAYAHSNPPMEPKTLISELYTRTEVQGHVLNAEFQLDPSNAMFALEADGLVNFSASSQGKYWFLTKAGFKLAEKELGLTGGTLSSMPGV